MKFMKVAVFFPMIFLTGSLLAQTPPSEFQIIKDELGKIGSLTDDTKRLKQYDALAAKYNPKLVKSKPAGKWIESVSINPLDDGRTIVLSNHEYPSDLLIRHSLGKTELFVSVDKYLGLDTTDVTFRVGKAEAETTVWSISSDHEAVFYSDDVDDLVKRMMDSEQFVTRITPYSSNSITTVFDIRGLKELLIKYKSDFGYEFPDEEKTEKETAKQITEEKTK